MSLEGCVHLWNTKNIEINVQAVEIMLYKDIKVLFKSLSTH